MAADTAASAATDAGSSSGMAAGAAHDTGSGSLAPASASDGATSGDSFSQAFSAFGAEVSQLLGGTESDAASGSPDGQTAGRSGREAPERAASGTEQSSHPARAAGKGAIGVQGQAGENRAGTTPDSNDSGNAGNAGGSGEASGADAGNAVDADFESRLKEQGLWDAFKRREQSAFDRGEHRATVKLGREYTASRVSQDHASLVRYVNELPQTERAAWLESLPDVQATVSSAQQAVAADLVGNVLGMDLAQIPARALEEAVHGRPDLLRAALIEGSRHIQSAIRTAHEAGTRASRSQLRGAFPLPPAGDSTRPARGQAETYEEARSTFSQAAAALLGSG